MLRFFRCFRANLKRAFFISIILHLLGCSAYVETTGFKDELDMPYFFSALTYEFRQHGVLVDEQKTGEIHFIFSGDRLFDPSTGRVIKAFLPVLDELSRVIQESNYHEVYIYVHSDNVGSPDENIKKSQLQAETIASYLWHRGILHEKLHYKGLGGQLPISKNRHVFSQFDNRRISIILR